MQKKSLGRGLSSLFETTTYHNVEEAKQEGKEKTSLVEGDIQGYGEIRKVFIAQISPGPFQPRKKFEEEDIQNLSASIKKQGILQPLIVRQKPKEEGKQYEIIAGERRWRAALHAGLKEVPVVIKDIENNQGLEIALIENIQREDLTALEEAEAYARLIEEIGYTQEALAEVIGKSRSYITNTLRLLQLSPYIKELLQEEKISAGHARALINQEDAETIVDLTIQKSFSVRQLEEYLRKKNKNIKQGIEKESIKEPRKDTEIKILEETLTQQIGLSTELSLNESGKGKIVIHIESLEDLDDFFQKLLSNTNPIVMSEA